MILFFDVETTGLPNYKERARHPSQPHIVQLAAMLVDGSGRTLESHNVIIKPDGWEIPKEASDVHGITAEVAAIGIGESVAARTLLEMMKKAELSVAHNLTFDKFLARIAMRRFELMTDEQDEWWKALPTFCTMRESTDLCKLPGIRAGQFKWPKLIEAYRCLFNEDFSDAHDALADVRACMRIYFELQKRKEVVQS